MSPDPHPSPPPIPLIDIAPLVVAEPGDGDVAAVAAEIDAACREIGFFAITGHGVPHERLDALDRAARAFFTLAESTKAQIAMRHAGTAWRGWFPVGGELTSGRPDRKEGIYIGLEHPDDHPRVVAGTALHGANLFPAEVPELRAAVSDWMTALRPAADALMRAIAIGLGMRPTWFEDDLTSDPTVLFRIFHYPPASAAETKDESDTWGVGEHTDYGLLTLLAQDEHGGLQVQTVDGSWTDVPPSPGVLVCNIGDMLERLTDGRYRSTPHRVRNTSGVSRLSFPYFFDPSWDATVPILPITATPTPRRAKPRWDGADVAAWDGTYGEYLTAKVAKVFPELFAATT